jgi:hypothetical protein
VSQILAHRSPLAKRGETDSERFAASFMSRQYHANSYGCVMKVRSAWITASACFLLCVASSAYCEEKPKASPGSSSQKRSRGVMTVDPKAEMPPCPRGTWKDDPICFGEGATDTLPTPSARSTELSGAPSNGPTIKPTANINARPGGPGPYQAGVIYQPNGNAVTSNYGGGLKMELPF